MAAVRSGRRSRTARAAGPARMRSTAMASIYLRSGWLCDAPNDPPSWKIAMRIALIHTSRLDPDLILRTVRPVAVACRRPPSGRGRRSVAGGVDMIDVKTTTQQAAERAARFLGPLLAIGVAWATDTVRGDMSIANAALALAFVCVAAALVNPVAGFLTSAVAALALNYFHTTPVHSLRMTEGDEIVTVVLLVLLGAAVSIATTLRFRAKVAVYRNDESLA